MRRICPASSRGRSHREPSPLSARAGRPDRIWSGPDRRLRSCAIFLISSSGFASRTMKSALVYRECPAVIESQRFRRPLGRRQDVSPIESRLVRQGEADAREPASTVRCAAFSERRYRSMRVTAAVRSAYVSDLRFRRVFRSPIDRTLLREINLMRPDFWLPGECRLTPSGPSPGCG
jgi:hypothetical protein